MERQYRELPIRELGAGAGFRRPEQPQPARVTLESPAAEVMTDLARVSPATIRPQAPLEGANQFMISRGVRLLLVVDVRDTVVGVLTATDVLGEKALRVAVERGVRRDELTAGDLMTPAESVEVIALRDVEGRYRSFAASEVEVVVDNPLEAHIEQLARYTDGDMHDVITYLHTLR